MHVSNTEVWAAAVSFLLVLEVVTAMDTHGYNIEIP